ncbi:MAG TPA: matrixin family metalloprotease [Methylomirabilota bacterium]|nr:matrixin family metalloprotease [Methylomirabilota bacterium]
MAKRAAPRRPSPPAAPRICFDRVVPLDYAPARAAAERIAIQHASAMARTTTIVAGEGVIHPLHMALVSVKKWDNGRTLKCRFLDGSAKQRAHVTAKARIWEQYANVKLAFVTGADAEIRISFSADPGSWSAIGTDCLVEQYFPKYQPTMNFGWLKEATPDQEYERVVVHEFGHALGCIHEHQSPAEHLKWNKAAVYRAFSGPPNYWSKADIDHNILEKYSKKGMLYTPFDPKSIMLYQFAGSLFTDGHATPLNTRLSATDTAMIAQMYPRP